MGWTFVYLMLFLKLPICGLLYIVWWAIKQTPEEADTQDGDGPSGPSHPRDPLPRSPRRGPHGEPAAPAPPRTRTGDARPRTPVRR